LRDIKQQPVLLVAAVVVVVVRAKVHTNIRKDRSDLLFGQDGLLLFDSLVQWYNVVIDQHFKTACVGTFSVQGFLQDKRKASIGTETTTLQPLTKRASDLIPEQFVCEQLLSWPIALQYKRGLWWWWWW
jgi:hypothetical protein